MNNRSDGLESMILRMDGAVCVDGTANTQQNRGTNILRLVPQETQEQGLVAEEVTCFSKSSDSGPWVFDDIGSARWCYSG